MGAAMNKALKRYEKALQELPESGGGGCHRALLGVATLGAIAGLMWGRVFDDLRQHARGERTVTNYEIMQAVNKAFAEHNPNNWKSSLLRKVKPRASAADRDALIDEGRGRREEDLYKGSPIQIDVNMESCVTPVLDALYAPDDLLFVGRRTDKGEIGSTIRPASQWITAFDGGYSIPPFIIPNPVTGEPGKTKGGKPSLRADECVAAHRFAVVEFDNLTWDDQIAFWWSVKLPICALIDSGNKSIHGWIRVDCESVEEWEQEIERKLYGELLTPLGVDSSCRNESRLSRMPGHKRSGKRWQRLLYLSPDGKPVHE